MQIEQLYKHWQECQGVSTDTRNIMPGSLFVALRGERFNGNDFVQQALDAGARLALADDKRWANNPQVILVDDSLKTLQQLAAWHRRQYSIPFIAVGGSNGKTTTKELIAKGLSARYVVYATPGNFNNHIGVPLTLLNMPADTEVAVIELGANHARETWELCEIVHPTHGLVTNVGKDHLEGFGSLEGVARANGELYDYLAQNKGIAFVNSQEEWLSQLAAAVAVKVTYPAAADSVPLTSGLTSAGFVSFSTGRQTYHSQLFGSYNFNNIATAYAVGVTLGVPQPDLCKALASYIPANMRSQVIQTAHNTLYLDAYNANPSSMAAAVNAFAQMPVQPRWVILGDMLELGSFSQTEHAAMGQLLSTLPFEQIVLVGPEMQHAHAQAPAARHFADRTAAEAWLKEQAPHGKQILLKASRGIGLEKLQPVL